MGKILEMWTGLTLFFGCLEHWQVHVDRVFVIVGSLLAVDLCESNKSGCYQ